MLCLLEELGGNGDQESISGPDLVIMCRGSEVINLLGRIEGGPGAFFT